MKELAIPAHTCGLGGVIFLTGGLQTRGRMRETYPGNRTKSPASTDNRLNVETFDCEVVLAFDVKRAVNVLAHSRIGIVIISPGFCGASGA